MVRALVTGSDDRMASVAEQLFADGMEVVTAAGVHELAALDVGEKRIDVYVQLPVTVEPVGDTLVARLRSFLADGLLARFALVEHVMPTLAQNATVVLVSGNTTTAGAAVPDDERSRLALLHLLAHATRAELASRGVQVTVVNGARTDLEVARFARVAGEDPTARLIPEAPEQVSSKDYQDWRIEMMGMANTTAG